MVARRSADFSACWGSADVMYKCAYCGRFFYEEDLEEEHYECPACGCNLEEADVCEGCGNVVLLDRLYAGHYCENCLREEIDRFTASKYMADRGFLAQFFLQNIFDCDLTGTPSKKLNDFFLSVFTEAHVADAVQFIMDDDGESGREDFAEWLLARGKGCSSQHVCTA